MRRSAPAWSLGLVDATVYTRDHGIADFRPGLPLADFNLNYELNQPEAGMKVVGHVGQMRQSRCYRESDTLTCTTCHDPHAKATGRADYVSQCLKCHSEASCRLDKDERIKRSAADDCVQCHMPQVPTEITHVAFTHHRIGIHAEHASSDKPAMMARSRPAELVPLDKPTGDSQLEQQRDLALAYFAYSQKPMEPAAMHYYQDRSRQLIEALRSQGWRGPETTAALARLYYAEQQPEMAYNLAMETLGYDKLLPKSRINALYFIGEIGLRANHLSEAQLALDESEPIPYADRPEDCAGVRRPRADG